jgi:hypothetical protein
MQTNEQQAELPPCPACGGDGSEREWKRTIAHGDNLRVESHAHRFLGAQVSALTCRNCGYVMLFIDPKDF